MQQNEFLSNNSKFKIKQEKEELLSSAVPFIFNSKLETLKNENSQKLMNLQVLAKDKKKIEWFKNSSSLGSTSFSSYDIKTNVKSEIQKPDVKRELLDDFSDNSHKLFEDIKIEIFDNPLKQENNDLSLFVKEKLNKKNFDQNGNKLKELVVVIDRLSIKQFQENSSSAFINGTYNCEPKEKKKLINESIKCAFTTNLISQKVHNSENESEVQCYQCPFKATDKFGLENHLKKCHEKEKLLQSQDQKCNTNFPSDLVPGDKVTNHLKKGKTKRIYNCYNCKFKTIQRNNFRRHVRTHRGVKASDSQAFLLFANETTQKNTFKIQTHSETRKKPFRCQVCEKSYSAETMLINHIVAAHSQNENLMRNINSKVYYCDLCEYKTVFINYLERHKLLRHIKARGRVKPDKRFECDMCDYKTRYKSVLKAHIRLHMGQQPFKCQECKKPFNTKQMMDYHILTRHSENKEFMNSITSTIHSCDICSYKTIKGDHLKNHMEKHADKTNVDMNAQKIYPCAKCDFKTVSSLNLKRHLKIHLQKELGTQYQCDICGYKTIHKNYLGIHVRAHSKKDHPFLCQECKKTFNTKANLDGHIVALHSKNKELMSTLTAKVYSCEVCDHKTTKGHWFKVHVQTHNGDKAEQQYQCDKCNYKTIYKSSIVNHIQIHTGNLPFQCVKCNIRFNTKKQLDCHIVKTHWEDKEMTDILTNKVFFCDECEYKSVQLAHFKLHVQRHRGVTEADKKYRCHLCQSRFLEKGALMKHIRIHTGNLPFICMMCDKKFNNKSLLDYHIAGKHLDDEEMMESITSKIHFCEICGVKTITSNQNKTHMKRFHKGVIQDVI